LHDPANDSDNGSVFEDKEAVDYDPRLRERYQNKSNSSDEDDDDDDIDNPLSSAHDQTRNRRGNKGKGYRGNRGRDREGEEGEEGAFNLLQDWGDDNEGSEDDDTDDDYSSVGFTYHTESQGVHDGIRDRLAERRTKFVKDMEGDGDGEDSVDYDDPDYESSVVTDSTKSGVGLGGVSRRSRSRYEALSNASTSSSMTPDYNY